MGATVLDDAGKAAVMHMGCYGIGVSRIVAAAIEQNHDDAGIVWPEPMAPWQVAICPINRAQSARRARATPRRSIASSGDAGIDAVLDDRGLRPARCSPTSN